METFELARSFILNDTLAFECYDLKKALNDGFFLVKIPSGIDVSSGLKLCHNFYKDSTGNFKEGDAANSRYCGYKSLDSVYFDREHFQTEHILTDLPTREKYFPIEVKHLADQMNQLNIVILKSVLFHIGISEDYWNKVTGGCVDNQGTHWFACSHYRSEVNKPGCPAHQDTGFVTVLYIDEPGLEARIDNRWIKIMPIPGYFVVNFGRSFEILTEKMAVPVKSVLHRVSKVTKRPGELNRVSMAAFTNIPNNLHLYQMSDKAPIIYQTVQEFLDEFNKLTWDDEHSDFGLTA